MNKIIIVLILVGLFLLLNNKPKDNFRGIACPSGTKYCFSGKHKGKCIMLWSNCNR
jgi:hypothetical protein